MILSEYLTSVRQRLEKATPGPWGYDDGAVFVEDGFCLQAWPQQYYEGLTCYGKTKGPGDSDGDSEFCASAPTDIAKLLKLVEIMSEALLRIQKGVAFHHKEFDDGGSWVSKIYCEALAEAERVIDDKS